MSRGVLAEMEQEGAPAVLSSSLHNRQKVQTVQGPANWCRDMTEPIHTTELLSHKKEDMLHHEQTPKM